jgi:hypothetical protein
MKDIKHNMEILKRGNDLFFRWTAKNLTKTPIKIKPGMALIHPFHDYIHTIYKFINFTKKEWIEPNETLLLIQEQLIKDKVDNYRFNSIRYKSLGLESASGLQYPITDLQLKKIRKAFQELALEFGLPEHLEQGMILRLDEQDKQIQEVVNRTPAKNGLPQIITITMEEGYCEKADKTEKDIQIIDRR